MRTLGSILGLQSYVEKEVASRWNVHKLIGRNRGSLKGLEGTFGNCKKVWDRGIWMDLQEKNTVYKDHGISC